MAITLPHYPLTNTGANDANKLNSNLAAITATDGTGATTGSGTANYLVKWLNATDLTDSIILQHATAPVVGIGIVSPVTVQSSNSAGLQLGGVSLLLGGRADNGTQIFYLSTNATGTLSSRIYSGYAALYSQAQGAHQFQVADTDAAGTTISWKSAYFIDSDRDHHIYLGDNAGAKKVTIYDSDNSPVITADSNGLVSVGSNVVLPKTSGYGIKVDTATPTFGWRDILGKIRKRGVGATDPADAVYIGGNIKAWQFAVDDEVWAEYHVPHDYVAGTDIYLHFHWSHNSAIVTGGNVTWAADIIYAKGYNQAPFTAEVTPTVTPDASTTQYQHMISEVQISAGTPGATQIDTDDLEPDGLILAHLYLSANNMTSSGGVPDPFLHETDVHYQSTNIATKQKAPNFYV